MSKKTNYKSYWKNQLNIKFTDEEFEYLWGVYNNIDSCMLCSKDFKSSFDKCLDHNHDTGEIRYILCRSCNNGMDKEPRKDSKTGITGITERGNSWVIDTYRNNKRIYKRFHKSKFTIEEVIQIKKKYIP